MLKLSGWISRLFKIQMEMDDFEQQEASAPRDLEQQSEAESPKESEPAERAASLAEDVESPLDLLAESAAERDQAGDVVEREDSETLRESEEGATVAAADEDAGPIDVVGAIATAVVDVDKPATSQQDETRAPPADEFDVTDGGENIEQAEVPVEGAGELEAEPFSQSPQSSEATGDMAGTATVLPDQAVGLSKETRSPLTLFVMCLRSIGKHLKSFYNMRLYPPAAPPLSKQSLQALYPFDLSPLYLLEDQRCFERIAAMKQAQRKKKRLKFRSPDECFRRESVALHVLGSKSDGQMPGPLSSLLNLESQPELRLRQPSESDPKATLLQKRRAKWVSDVENQPPQPEETALCDTAQLKPKRAELKELKLHRHAVTNVGCGYIAEMIQGQSSLTYLSLQNCQITCAGAVILANALKSSKTVRRLDLSNNDSKAFRGHAFDNDIRSAGSSALASALERNRSLVYLSLKCNHVGVTGATAIAAMLQKNSSLRNLELSKTDVDEAAVGLIRAFERSTTLEVLNLQWCALRPGLGAQLAKIQVVKSSRQPQRS